MMYYHGYITEQECALAKSIHIEDQLAGENNGIVKDNSHSYQSYIDAVIEEEIKLTGKDPATTSMIIYTYMDPKVKKKNFGVGLIAK